MEADLILYNIGQLVTCRELPNSWGTPMENIEILERAYVAIKNGKFIDVGRGELPTHLISLNTHMVDIGEKVVTPGLVDSHTHLVHGGSREEEFLLKIKGVPYLEILKAGGGILNTVKATRRAHADKLIEKARDSLDRMLSYGVTTIESKSGYGLDIHNEIKQLKINKILNTLQPIDIVSTFLGAHMVPEEFKDDRKGYIDEVIGMLPLVREQKIAEFCDVFCEEGAFTYEESRRILEEAKKAGFRIKIHADGIKNSKGAQLAAEMHAVSADHLMAVSDEGIEALAENRVIANILPGTSFNLEKNYAPVRKMIERGIQIALSTDYNPDTCPTENLQLIMQIAAHHLHMSPKEVFKAVTINGARSLGREGICGSIEEGKKADLTIFKAPNIDYILYHFGVNHTEQVYKNGNLVYKK